MKKRGEVNIYSLLNRLKHDGYALFCSVSQYHVVAGVLGVSSLILAIKNQKNGYLRDVLSEIGSSKKLGFIAGLQNHGNNCFLNVVLQALASCESFQQYIQSIAENVGISVEEMPLTDALDSLFRELCVLREELRVLSPRKVICAMDDYIPSFNLTMEQDAAEAFLHLLSSLREELLEFYVPHCHSLADIYAIPLSRVSSPLWGHQSEWQRWQQYLLGPFDGILCSTLACRSCSSQLSMGYEFFHSLSLSPLLDNSETILEGSSIGNCLKKFTAAELIENYHCNQCWHNSAIKYLSTIEGNETHIGKLKCCTMEDSCHCRNLFPEKAKLWSNNFSCAIKQLRVARCPKILCIHLQRASVNKFGESVKLQGHISFPMILDLFPFTKDAVGGGIENLNENFRMMKVKQHQPPNPRLHHLNMQLNKQMLKCMYGTTEGNVISEAIVGDDLGGSIQLSHDKQIQAFEGESRVIQYESCFPPKITRMPLLSDNKIGEVCRLTPSTSCLYQLVSVVEHFGRVGSGHYTVYRRVKHESDGQDSAGQFESAQWFCASDSKVFNVSEEEVLAAEASLLFYERVVVPKEVPIPL